MTRKLFLSSVGVLAAAIVVSFPEVVLAQDLGQAKLAELSGALKTVAITGVGIAGILAGCYIAFGRQDGNEKLGQVVKGAIVLSVIVSTVSWLAS